MPLSYVWSDNQSPQVATGIDSILTVKATSIVEPWLVTLTITDDDGEVSVITREVPIQRTSDGVEVRGMYAAWTTSDGASPGGQQFWYDQAVAAGADASVACSPIDAGIAVYGYTNGRIYRTTDFLRTAPTLVYSGLSEVITDIEWDLDDPRRVWAVSRSGRVLLSEDKGATWRVHSVLRDVLAEPQLVIYRMDSQPRGTATVLRVFGGNGRGEPVIAYAIVPTAGWQRVMIGGQLRTDLDSFVDATRYVRDGTSAGRDLAIILNSANHHPCVYYTTDMLDASKWKRATGAIDSVSLTRGRWIERDLEDGWFVMGCDTTAIYLGRVNGSGVLQTWAAPSTIGANRTVQDALWVGRAISGIGKVFLLATDNSAGDGIIYKTTDRFATVSSAKSAPAGGDALMVALGPAATPVNLYIWVQASPIASVASTYSANIERLARGDWQQFLDAAGSVSQNPVQFTRAFSGVMFRAKGPNTGSGGGWHPSNLERSTDNGVTWTQVFALTTSGGKQWGVQGLAQGADGRLWLCCAANDTSVVALPSPAVYVSDDDGATWTLAYEDTTQDAGLDRVMSDICTHPTDPMLIYVTGGRSTGDQLHWFSDDGGVTFNVYSGGGAVDSTHQRQCVMLANRRIILMEQFRGNLRYSDDYGASWTTAAEFTGQYPVQLIRDKEGLLAFAIGGTSPNGKILRTRTFGVDWEQITDANSVLLGVGWYAVAYHDKADVLLITSDLTTGTTQRTMLIEDAGAVEYGVVQDLSLNLVTAMGTQSLARQGILLP